MAEECYMCEEKASSTEHAPPMCIFPEQKDLPEGMDYRVNLITVPSCDEHNSNKSMDDEYLLFVLVHGYFNNDAAKHHFFTKLTRAFERRPHVLQHFYASRYPTVVDGVETVAVNIDIERFDKAISNMCRALYYDMFKEKWSENFKVYTAVLLAMYQDNEDLINNTIRKIVKGAQVGLKDCDTLGENPDIFQYQILRNRDKKQLLCRLVFYGGFEVISVSDPRLLQSG